MTSREPVAVFGMAGAIIGSVLMNYIPETSGLPEETPVVVASLVGMLARQWVAPALKLDDVEAEAFSRGVEHAMGEKKRPAAPKAEARK